MILYVSSQSADGLSWFSQLWKYDKVVHFIEYLGVGFLLVNAMKIKTLKNKHWKFALIFLFIFPIIDETLQHYSPQRIPDIIDGIVDIIGGLTGAYIRKYI